MLFRSVVRIPQFLARCLRSNVLTGVGASTPVLSLFKTPAEAFEFYSIYPLNLNNVTDASALGTFYAQAQILGKLAVDRYKTSAESVGTVAVANDMLEIAKAFARYGGKDEDTVQVNYWGVS